MPLQRNFLVKVYDQDGTTPLRTLSSQRPDDGSDGYLKNAPDFESRINAGFGELVLDLALPIDDYDEGNSVDFMNVVKVYSIVVDPVALSQADYLIYTGFVSKYEPYLEPDSQGVRVTCLGLVSLSAAAYYKAGSSFTVTHTGQDPSVIAEAVIDHFNTVYGGNLLSYTGDSVQSVGTAVSLTFTDQKHGDVLRKVLEVSGAGWWSKVDEYGVYHLKQKPSTPTHTFTVGLDVVRVVAPKDSEKVVNDVQVRGADGITADVSDAASQAEFGTGSPATGKRSLIVTDSTLTDTAALNQRGNKVVEDGKDAKTKATVVVNTNYPIETVKVGETCRVRNLEADIVPDNAQIVAVRYRGDTIEIDLEEQPSDFGRELGSLITNTAVTSSGSGGGGGGGGDSDFVDRETPSGSVNGVNATFNLSQTPIAGSEHIWVNGVLQNGSGNDYSISSGTITFTTAPASGSVILVSYRVAVTDEDFADKEVPTGSVDGVNTSFTLANTPTAGSLHLYVNGILQNEGSGLDYELSGTTITFTSAPASGSVILVSYRY